MVEHVYAWLCDSCQHLVSGHRLMVDAEIEGPYLCECGCAILQSSPMTALDRRRFEERFPDLVNRPEGETAQVAPGLCWCRPGAPDLPVQCPHEKNERCTRMACRPGEPT